MKKFNEIMILMQLISLLVLMGGLIYSAFEPSFLNVCKIICGITLLIIAYNNHTAYKRKYMTIIYGLFGIFMVGLAIFEIYG